MKRAPLGFLRIPAWLCLAAALCFAGRPEPARAAELPNPLELLELLRAGDFVELEARLGAHQRAYEAGESSDLALELAYGAFGNTGPDLGGSLDRWVSDRPASHAARLARGVYNVHLGWVTRGSALGRDTPDQHIDGMARHFAVAEADLREALRLKPDLGLAYAQRIGMAKALGRNEETEALMRQGLAADPRSYSVRSRYLGSQVPWWGGRSRLTWDRIIPILWTYALGERVVPDSITAFLQEVEADAVDNPALRPLLGYRDFVIAEVLTRERERADAVRFYESALRFGDGHWYLRTQGENFYRDGRYPQALQSFSRALAVFPMQSETLDWRARSYRALGQLDRAFADWDLALALDALNPRILRHRAYALRDQERYDEALADLDHALVYGAEDEWVRDARGRLFLDRLDQPEKAIPEFRRTTELNPRRKRHWYHYGRALYRIKDCKTVEVLTVYRFVCQKPGQNCKPENLLWAEEVIEYLNQPLICSS